MALSVVRMRLQRPGKDEPKREGVGRHRVPGNARKGKEGRQRMCNNYAICCVSAGVAKQSCNLNKEGAMRRDAENDARMERGKADNLNRNQRQARPRRGLRGLFKCIFVQKI